MASRESAEDRVARLKAAIAKGTGAVQCSGRWCGLTRVCGFVVPVAVESDLDLALKVEQEAAKVAEPANTHSARPISPPLSDDGESVRPWNDGDSVLPPESTSKQRTRARTAKRATRTTRSPAQSRYVLQPLSPHQHSSSAAFAQAKTATPSEEPACKCWILQVLRRASVSLLVPAPLTSSRAQHGRPQCERQRQVSASDAHQA